MNNFLIIKQFLKGGNYDLLNAKVRPKSDIFSREFRKPQKLELGLIWI